MEVWVDVNVDVGADIVPVDELETVWVVTLVEGWVDSSVVSWVEVWVDIELVVKMLVVVWEELDSVDVIVVADELWAGVLVSVLE